MNCDTLWKNNKELEHDYEVDSEVILELFHKYICEGRTPEVAMEETFEKIQGMASVIGISQEKNCFVAATNNGSLYYCKSEDGNFTVFASEALILKKLLEDIPKLSSCLLKEHIKRLSF